MGDDPFEELDQLVKRIETIVMVGCYGYLLWTLCPETIRCDIRHQGRTVSRRVSTWRASSLDRKRLASEVWHIRSAMDDYNRGHDRLRFARAIGVRSAPAPRAGAAPDVDPPEDA